MAGGAFTNEVKFGPKNPVYLPGETLFPGVKWEQENGANEVTTPSSGNERPTF